MNLHYQTGEAASSNRVSRRAVLRTALRVTAAGALIPEGVNTIRPASLLAQSELTPRQALQKLLDGNRRFVEGRMNQHTEDLAILRQHTEEKQEPFAAVLSCADSRVPVELIFDQSIGHVFVTRLAGNVVTTEILASLEYGAAVLGTKVIVVIGHSNCGAVKATIAGKDVPGQISALYLPLRPAIEEAGPDLVAATKANARIQAKLLKESSTVISGLAKAGKISVAAAYYDLANGTVTMLTKET